MSERPNTSYGPESSGPIQVIPPGLLGFLQLKNSGQNPHSIDLTISPAIELRDWLFNASHSYAQIGVSIAAATPGFQGDANLVTVPQNEYWWVHDASVTCDIVTGERISFGLAYRQSNNAPASSNIVVVDGWRPDVSYAGANVYSVVSTSRNFWLPGGCQLGVYSSCADYAGPKVHTIKMRLTRLTQ